MNFQLLLLLCLATVTAQDFWQDNNVWPPTTYALLGSSFTIKAQRIANSTVYWRKEREGYTRDVIGNKYAPIAHAFNCNYAAAMNGRIVRCDQDLTIINSTRADAGIYLYRAHVNKTYQKFEFHNLSIVDLKPTLGLLRLNKLSVSLRCDDLVNKDSITKIETKNLHPGTGWVIEHKDHVKEIAVGGQTGQPILWRARCCATHFNLTSCGQWRKINHDRVLCNGRAQGRNWCQFRGDKESAAKMTFHHLVWRPLPKGECQRTIFSILLNNTQIRLCHYQPQTILGPSLAHPFGWMKYRIFGGVTEIMNSSKQWIIPEPFFNYSANYYLQSTEGRTNFSIRVEEELQATVEPIRIYDNRLTVKCAHNGPGDKPTITWEVMGIYEKYVTYGPELTMYPDCWMSYTRWHFQFALRCHVRDGPWFTTSDWFRAEGTRTGGNCYRYIDNKED
nr:MAG: putative 10.5 kDa protein [unidentified adenovirus]